MAEYKWIWSAFIEFIINMLASLLPFCAAIAALMLSGKTSHDLQEAVNSVIKNGELIIYSATLMAPIIYAVLRDPPVKFRALLAISSGIPVMLGVIVYVLFITENEFSDKLITASVITFAIGILSFLSLIAIEHKVKHGESAASIQHTNTNIMLDTYRKHRESKG